jgi:fermentation-respiration switch protein FrsA (DUF1100 family)
MGEIIIPGIAGTLGLMALCYLSVCLYLLIWQRRLILLPQITLAAEPGLTGSQTKPSDLGMDYEEVWISSPEHHQAKAEARLHGWWLPVSQNHPGGVDRVLLYLHGNSGQIGNNLAKASRFQRLGFSILMFDYRGYGRSEGSFPSEQRMYADAQMALDFLIDTKQIQLTNIYLYGHSLGGAIAIEQATKRPELAGLIIESSFTSMLAMATSNPKYRLFPVDLLLHQRFDSIAKIPSLKMPILYIHGTEDADVPAYMSKELYAATTAPKQLLIIEGANHVNVAEVAEQKYLEAVQNLVAQVEQSRSLPGVP